MSSFTTKGTKFKLRGHTNKKILIFVHGLGLKGEMWQWLPKELEQEFTIVTYDIFGHGESSLPEKYPTLTMFSLQIKELMDHCNFDRIILAGFSLGGMIVRRFAQDFPELVEGLIIINSPHVRSQKQQKSIEARVSLSEKSGPTATISAAITRWFSENFIKGNPLIIDKVKKWILSNDPIIYPKIYKILAYDLEEIIKPQPPINCPTLIITADQDYGNGPEMSEKIANEISQSQMHIMRNLKHMGLVEDPNQFGSIIKPFLRQFTTVGSI